MSIGGSAFDGCVRIMNIICQPIVPPLMSDNAFCDETYHQATLVVPNSEYVIAEGWRKFNNIVLPNTGYTITANVLDPEGRDISSEVKVLWFEGDKEIANSSTINGIEEGTELLYSVLLDDDLGCKFKEVNKNKIVVGTQDTIINIQLQPIEKVTLRGRVSATDIDKTAVTVNVKQMLNGKYEQTCSTKTDEQGIFSIEVYDDVTDIIFRGAEYFDANLHRAGFNGNGELGIIPMSLLSGYSIATKISLAKAVTSTQVEQMSEWTESLNNIEFSLYNKSKNSDVYDFTTQNGNIIIKQGAEVGDMIRLTAKSKLNIFAETTTDFVIEEDANRLNLLLTELGGVDVTYASSNNASTIGYLYNANGALVAKAKYIGDKLSLRHLPNGSYILVSMGISSLFGNVNTLANLKELGLNEGTDYITENISVVDGLLTETNIAEVPVMDDTRFYYTSGNTYFNTNKASITSGNYITLSAHLDFKDDYRNKIDDVKLEIELPEGCQFVPNSVIANRKFIIYSVDDNRLIMNLKKEEWEGEIRFCLIPQENKIYSISAIASFDLGGQILQSIGTACFESKGFDLNVPELTTDTKVVINGKAKGISEVSIYDNDVIIGKTISKADGTWSASCELYKPFSHSFHDIYAKIIGENGLELTSETKQVEYDKDNIVPKSVTMTFYNGWYKENKTIEFNLIDGTTSPSNYPFYSAADFTFLADFTKNDSSVIKNVNIKVLNSDGTVRTLPATFDGKQGKWVATTKYSSANKLPQNVMVEYDYVSDASIYDVNLEQFSNTIFESELENLKLLYGNGTLDVISHNDEEVLFSIIPDGSSTKEYFKVKKMDYEKTIEGIDDRYIHISENDNDVYMVDSFDSECYTLLLADNKNKEAFCFIYNGTKSFTLSNQGKIIQIAPLLVSIAGGIAMSAYERWWLQQDEIDYWRSCLESDKEMSEKKYKALQTLLYAKCEDGKLKIDNPEFFYLNKSSVDGWKIDLDVFLLNYKRIIDITERSMTDRFIRQAVVNTVISVAGFGVGKYLGRFFPSFDTLAGVVTKKEVEGLKNFFNTVNTGSLEFLGQVLGISTNELLDWQTNPRESISNWYSRESKKLTESYISIAKDIKTSYGKCKEKEEQDDEPLDEKTDNKPEFPGSGSTGIIDPSGYVYEAVLSNRLEGVTATCYQQTQTEDMYGDITEEAVIWNAEDYSQQNPLKTDKNGFYRWDVPQGMWQVKYEKEGYETVYSGWLPVPPPQLDVNIGMTQSTPPEVKQMRGTESGITIDMTKYMLPATMTTANITVSRNGKKEQGTIEMLNAEQAPLSGETYAQKVKFVPNTRFNTSDDVVVTVHKDVESYCGIPMTADHQQTVEIESEITDIVVDETVIVPYQGERNLRVLILPKEASVGRRLHVKSSSSMIASVSASDFVVDEDGSATVTISGELPGGVMLDFEVEGTDVTATSQIQVKNMSNEVMTPTANIPSGASVPKGTEVELSCDTEGATIYYTLDGSCPCDETSRILYTSPIIVNENVIISVIAVAPGLYDSDVVEYRYVVDEENVHVDEILFDDKVDLYPLPMRERINVRMEGKIIDRVTITNTEGKVMGISSKSSDVVSLDVHSLTPGIYVISILTEGRVYSRKVRKSE